MTEETQSPNSAAQQPEAQTEKPTDDATVRVRAVVGSEAEVSGASLTGRETVQEVSGAARPAAPASAPDRSPVEVEMRVGPRARARRVTLTGVKEVSRQQAGGRSPRGVDETRLLLVRVATLVIGVLGLIGGVIWLLKAVPGFTLGFLIPLLIIVVAVVLGVMGILKPEQIVVILTGQRDSGQE